MLEEILNPNSIFFWLLILSILAVVFAFIIRYFTPYVKFIYPNAKFEAIGNPFLIEKELQVLAEHTSLDAFKDRVNVLRDYQVTGDTVSSIQSSLDQNLLQTMRMMQNDSPKKMHAFYEIYLQRIDFYLVKNEIKQKLQGSSAESYLDKAILPITRDLLDRINHSTKETMPALLASYDFDTELIEELSKENPDMLQIDILFDKQFLRRLKDVSVPRNCEQTKQDFIKHVIDMLLIKHLLRAKHLSYPPEVCKTMFLGEGKQIAQWRFEQMVEAPDIPQLITAVEGTTYFSALSGASDRYGKEKSVHLFEQVIHGSFLQRVRELSLQNYQTIGPSLRFLVSKEFEIQNLKVIVKGIAEQLSKEMIQPNLVTEATS